MAEKVKSKDGSPQWVCSFSFSCVCAYGFASVVCCCIHAGLGRSCARMCAISLKRCPGRQTMGAMVNKKAKELAVLHTCVPKGHAHKKG